jgi:hypothetical protein
MMPYIIGNAHWDKEMSEEEYQASLLIAKQEMPAFRPSAFICSQRIFLPAPGLL